MVESGRFSLLHIRVRSARLLRAQARLDAALTALNLRTRTHLWTIAELSILLIWALYVTRRLLNMDPLLVPVGNEFGVVTQFHYIWRLLPECGACVFWNGMANGGSPAFVDLHGAVLNPFVFFSTLLLGVINGTKIVLVLSIFLAGLAQWWLARLLGVGRLARIWSSSMAIAGAHIAGRMQLGLATMILAIAVGGVVFAAWVHFLQSPSRRAAVGLGVLLGLLLLSGQGYVQYVTILGVFPSGVILLLGKSSEWKLIGRQFVVAVVIALLVVAPLLIPTIHFWPNMSIHGDPGLGGSQSLEYLPLNLVIRDLTFFNISVLGRIASPALFLIYVGWVPVLLAVVGATGRTRRAERSFLLVSAAVVFFLASSFGPRMLAKLMPTMAATLRYPSLGACLAVTPILGLSALGLDGLVHSERFRLKVTTASGKTFAIQAWYVLLAIPLFYAVKTAYDVSRLYLETRKMPDLYYDSLPLLSSARGEWIAAPRGDFNWYPILQSNGFLLAYTFHPWDWAGRDPVEPYYEGSYLADTLGHPDYLQSIAGVHWMLHRENEFAFIDTGSHRVPCEVRARGGNIDVECDSRAPGTLIVMEYAWTGWVVSRDGEPAELTAGQWLATRAASGKHTYAFRYRPWDAPLGLALAGLGTVLAAWNWLRKDKHAECDDPHSSA